MVGAQGGGSSVKDPRDGGGGTWLGGSGGGEKQAQLPSRDINENLEGGFLPIRER